VLEEINLGLKKKKNEFDLLWGFCVFFKNKMNEKKNL